MEGGKFAGDPHVSCGLIPGYGARLVADEDVHATTEVVLECRHRLSSTLQIL
jgi:hypothetical protein